MITVLRTATGYRVSSDSVDVAVARAIKRAWTKTPRDRRSKILADRLIEGMREFDDLQLIDRR